MFIRKIINFFIPVLILFIGISSINVYAANIAPKNSVRSVHIVATINNASITNLDINLFAKLLLMNSGQSLNAKNLQNIMANQQVLRFSITEKLQIQAAEKYHITASKADMDHAIQMYLSKNKITKKELIKRLHTYKVPQEFFIKFMKDQIQWQKFVGLSARSSLRISDFEVQERLNQIKQLLHKPLKHVYVITIPIYSSSDIPHAQQVIQEIYKKLQKGIPFPQLAKQYISPQAGKSDLGFIHVQSLPPQIASVLSSMSVGKYTKPIRIPSGVTIFYIAATKEPKNIKEPTQEQVRNLIINERIEILSQRTLNQLWQQSFITLNQNDNKTKTTPLTKANVS